MSFEEKQQNYNQLSGYYMIDDHERKRLLYLVRLLQRRASDKLSDMDKGSIKLAIASLTR